MKFIIIGCGRMGSGLAHNLSLLGHDLTVVDRDPDALRRLGPGFQGHKIVGVGFDRAILTQAGVAQADGLAAVTGSDEANVVIARVARQYFHVPRVVARLFDPRKAEIYRRLGLATIAPVTWGIQRMAESLVLPQLHAVFTLDSGEIDLVEVELPPTLAGRRVHDLAAPGEVQVTALRRKGRTFLPTPDTVIQPGDLAYLAVARGVGNRLRELLRLD